MPPNSQSTDLPLITVGIVVFNRAWIIEKMLASLIDQTYPHDRLFVVVVDGKSKDDTVTIAEQTLAASGLKYQVIVKESNIPEARNLCIENMKGDFLLFWDSDVIMESTAISSMLDAYNKMGADFVATQTPEVFIESAVDIDKKWPEWKAKAKREERYVTSDCAGAGFSLISKKVLNQVKFDTDYTHAEDFDFSFRVSGKGFKIVSPKNIIGFDVNSKKQAFSDIYSADAPLKNSIRGISKKSKVQFQVATCSSPSIPKASVKFFLSNKRYLFYLGYIPALLLTVYGVLTLNLWVSLVFPVYFLLFACIQLKKKGAKRGLNSAIRSILVGLPSACSLLYYSIKYSIKRPKRFYSLTPT